jgi:hypothetical protein
MASSILDEFLCPITFEIMVDPVICEDGYTYERSVIMSLHNSLSPMTRQPIDKTKLIPNRALKSAIDRFLLSNPQYQDIILERINKNNHDMELKASIGLEAEQKLEEKKQKVYKIRKFKKEIKQLWNYCLEIFFLFVLVSLIMYLINLIYLNCSKSMFSAILIFIFIVTLKH